MTPELRHLRALVALERHGSITAAARSLGYSQPALSRQLRRAEAAAGEPLVRRLGRRAVLTERGRELTRAADVALAVLDHAAGRRIGSEPDPARPDPAAGPLRADPGLALLAPESLFAWLIPDLLARLPEDRHRAVLHVGGDPLAVERLRAGELDAAIVTGLDSARAPRDVRVVPILHEPVLIALPPGHPASRDGSVSLRALARERWIDGPHPDCLGHFAPLRLERPAHHVGSGAAKAALLRGGGGVSGWPAASRRAAHGLALRRPRERPVVRRLDLLLRRHDADHAQASRLLAALDGAIRARPGGVGRRLVQ